MLGRRGCSAGSAVTHLAGPGVLLGGQARSSEALGRGVEGFCSALSGGWAGPPARAARAGAGLPARTRGASEDGRAPSQQAKDVGRPAGSAAAHTLAECPASLVFIWASVSRDSRQRFAKLSSVHRGVCRTLTLAWGHSGVHQACVPALSVRPPCRRTRVVAVHSYCLWE